MVYASKNCSLFNEPSILISPDCIGQLGNDEEPIGVVPDIGNVDLTDAKKKKKKKQKQKGLVGGGKRRNKPRFKLVR